MIREITYTEEAQAEFLTAVNWYQSQNPKLGREFIGAVYHIITQITEWPLSFAHNQNNVRKAPLVTFPYCVFYKPDHERIVIIGVRHDRRRPKKWK